MSLCVCRCACVFVCAGGYINISYAMMLPLFLSTLDLVSDILFIWRLSNSRWRIGAKFLDAAMFVLGSSIFGNFVAFFGIFIYSHKKGKVSFHGLGISVVVFDSSATTPSAFCLTDYTTNANCIVPIMY